VKSLLPPPRVRELLRSVPAGPAEKHDLEHRQLPLPRLELCGDGVQGFGAAGEAFLYAVPPGRFGGGGEEVAYEGHTMVGVWGVVVGWLLGGGDVRRDLFGRGGGGGGGGGGMCPSHLPRYGEWYDSIVDGFGMGVRGCGEMRGTVGVVRVTGSLVVRVGGDGVGWRGWGEVDLLPVAFAHALMGALGLFGAPFDLASFGDGPVSLAMSLRLDGLVTTGETTVPSDVLAELDGHRRFMFTFYTGGGRCRL